jgi:hypothetical protein
MYRFGAAWVPGGAVVEPLVASADKFITGEGKFQKRMDN